MAVTPLGNVIQINQNAHVAANKAANVQNRFDIQALAANEIAKDKQKEVEEVRPTEETYEIDEDREHEKHHADDERKHGKKREHEEEEEKEQGEHHLDIKV